MNPLGQNADWRRHLIFRMKSKADEIANAMVFGELKSIRQEHIQRMTESVEGTNWSATTMPVF